ncbi:MAG: H+/Na+-translocating ferredoxin:NAD+ oxidoreductase subunit [Thermodesulfobacteriota bacterium]|nr:H+/Na+-translocating ferredoxin:NAD+ oxidoreductase subunit [Thermodesulfobacteriota bacterium]
MNRNVQLLWNGLIPENPIFRLALSLCPAVAVTTSVKNGLLLGLAVVFVQVFSSCTVSAFKSFIHPRIRIPAYVVIIALWVTVIDMILPVISPDVYKQVALFVKLIVVFAIIISRLELFASKEPFVPSFFDGLGMGIGFTFGLCLTGAIREFFGAGQLFGYDVLGFKPLLIMILPAGGFFVIGFIMATFNWIEYKLTGKIPASGGGH